MNFKHIEPNFKSKRWLLYCLNQGYSQRQMANLCNVSPITIRAWLKKYDIKWRSISESLICQSQEVSERSTKSWESAEKRKAHSVKMKQVLSTRKQELSIAAKKNWESNRDSIIAGIQLAAKNPKRNLKISNSLKAKWESNEYKQAVSLAIKLLWQDTEFKSKIITQLRSSCNTPEYSAIIIKRWQDPEYRNTIIKTIRDRLNDPEFIKMKSNISKSLWNDIEYRKSQQINKKASNVKVSQTISQLWKDDDYRAKHQTGINIDKFIAMSFARYSDKFNYDSTRFISWADKINVKCNICKKERLVQPQSHIEHGYCPRCNTSAGQREIAEFLQPHGELIINDRDMIHPLELDIYIPKYGVAVEYHGLYWHSYNEIETKSERYRHQTKHLICKESNIQLLQFFDFELINKAPIVKSMILNRIGLTQNKSHARQLNILPIEEKTSSAFFTANHLQGHRPAAVTLALVDKSGQILMAMSFNKYLKGYEIIRMASKIDTYVIGGMSKLLAYFIRYYSPKFIMTYADLRYSTAKGYINVGFKPIATTKPGYFYYRGNQTLSRQKCQKTKLIKLLGNGYDPILTEAQNMFNNGFRRVWDAGHMKLLYETES
jgi:hypothetical protein